MAIFAENFSAVFRGVEGDLSTLLGVGFRPGEVGSRTPIGISIAAINDFHSRGDHDHRDWNILRLALLEKQLRLISEKRPDLFPEFRARLLSEDPDHYLGTRFEVLIAANLAYRELNFHHPDPPDFLVENSIGPVALECTSATYRGSDLAKLRVKIRKVLNKKAKRAAAWEHLCGGLANAVVLVDTTTLHHASDRRGRIFRTEDLEVYSRERIEELRFGACILFTLILDRSRDSFEATYIRSDSSYVSDRLKRFLDDTFPINREGIYNDYIFPPTT